MYRTQWARLRAGRCFELPGNKRAIIQIHIPEELWARLQETGRPVEDVVVIVLWQPFFWIAVQVASAVLVEELSEIEVTFVSGDKQALRTAQFEALEVDNPFDHVGDRETGGEV
jgi:hypothetical protein